MKHREKTQVEAWLDKVGRARFTKETGRSHQTVHRACQKGKFPSGWFLTTRDWCEANDIEVPEHLFDWTLPSAETKQNGDSEAANQEAAQ